MARIIPKRPDIRLMGQPSVAGAGTVALASSDTTPDQFTFVDQTDVAVGTQITSAAITISGLGVGQQAQATVSGGTHSLNGGSFTSAAFNVSNGNTVRVRHTSSASNSTATNTTETINGISDIFTSTTVAAGVQVVNVSTAAALASAVSAANVTGNRDIRLADGTYTLSDTLQLNGSNITVQSQSGVRANVVVQGDAMSAVANVGNVFRVTGSNVTIKNITIERCRWSAIQLSPDNGTINTFAVDNCILRDTYEHMVKVSKVGVVGSTNGLMRNCLCYYTAGIAPNYYTGGIDVHQGSGWNVIGNTFRDIASPGDFVSQAAVNFWDGSTNNVYENNLVFDCDRGIVSGLAGNPANSGDTIRNNFVYHSANSAPFADVGIAVENSTNCKVYNNTVFLLSSLINWAMEYRFTTTGADFKNNLCNQQILARNGGTASLANNVTNAQAGYFVDVTTGPKLASAVAGVVNSGATIAGFSNDFEGTARPQGTSWDIGADEFIETSNPLSLPLYDTSKITYLRKILVPNGGSALNGGIGYEFASRPAGIAFNPAGNGGLGSIFMSGGPETQSEVISEFTIPLVNNTRASVLQSFQLTAAGKQGQIKQGELGVMCTGLAVYPLNGPSARLLQSWVSFYDTEAQPTAYMARSSLTLAGGTCTNPQRIGALTNQRFMSGLGCEVPANWRPVFGNYPMLGGGSGACSIAGNYSCGPALVLFDPAELDGSGVVGGVELCYYQLGDMDVSFGPFSSIWSNNSFHRGTIWLPESRTVLCFGKHGDSVYNGTNSSVSQVRTRFWLYDAVDLKRVFDGEITPRAVRPYATFDLNTGPGNGVPQSDEVRSCTWDPVGRLLYVMCGHSENSFPSIFVFSIPV